MSWTRGSGVLAVNVELTRDNGSNWQSLADDLTDPSFAWTITYPFSTQAKIRVYDPTADGRQDVSNATFAIANVPPATVTDLGIPGVGKLTLAVSWTAPGDDGAVGQAQEYDLRYSTNPIAEGNFLSATRLTTQTPSFGGSHECKLVTGLSACVTYYFALKTRDDLNNWSAISNVASHRTECVHNYFAECDFGEGAAAGGLDPVELGFAPPYPNPARGSAQWSVAVPAKLAGAHLTVQVLDLLGRRVRSIVDGPTLAGTRTIQWDLTSGAGEAVAPGLYLVQMRLGGEQRSFRLLVAP